MSVVGWKFYQEITLSSSEGLDDYQVQFTINRSEGTSSGSNIYVGTKCLETYADIRFVNALGEDLPYFIYSSTSSTATIWVKVDHIGSGTKIYVYYGNSTATAVSDGISTFLLFDDFSTYSGSGDANFLSKWTVAAGSCSITGGILTVNASGSIVKSATAFGVNTAAHLKVNVASMSVYSSFGYTAQAPSTGYAFFYTNFTTASTMNFITAANATNSSTNCSSQSAAYHNYEVQRGGTSNVKAYIDGSLKATHTSNFPTGQEVIYFYAQSQNVLVDHIFVRAYSATGITYDAVGSEQFVTYSSQFVSLFRQGLFAEYLSDYNLGVVREFESLFDVKTLADFVSQYDITASKDFETRINKIYLDHVFVTRIDGLDPVTVEFRTRVQSVTGISAYQEVV